MIALDLFAGSGWGVACQRLGIEELGVEIMPEARATRAAAGMATVFDDVWTGLKDSGLVPDHDILIASPPCQTFSAAGSGSGRRALGEVLELIERKAHHGLGTQLKQDAAALGMDDRTALVLTPLAYAYRHMPNYIALEQVPSVLPVWEAYAEELFGWGYSVATGILNAEQFGVPQTRKRAFLIAMLDGGLTDLELPKPTHSRYHNRDPKRLDPGVLPWVSMAEALGSEKLERVLRSNYGTGGDPANRGERAESQPAPTITSKANRMKWMELVPEGGNWRDLPEDVARKVMGAAYDSGGGRTGYARRLHRDKPSPTILGQPDHRSTFLGHPTESRALTPEECAVLQTFPADFPFQGTKTRRHLQIGNAVPPLLAEVVLKHLLS